MYVTPIEQRKTGRPNVRWKEVGKLQKALGIRNWWSTAMNREEWRQRLRQAFKAIDDDDDDDDDDDHDDDDDDDDACKLMVKICVCFLVLFGY
jgi:hypothetical protein